MKELSEIEIDLDSVQEGLTLWISSKRDGTLFDGIETAIENNEARFQLIEGYYYDYEISDGAFMLGDIGENIIQQHKLDYPLPPYRNYLSSLNASNNPPCSRPLTTSANE